MGYNVSVQLISNNRSNQPLTPQGIVIHATDTPGAPAQNERNYFNNTANLKANAHMFIDWNDLIQCVPWNEISWGCGPTGNSKYWNIELCEPATNDPQASQKFQATWDRAVWFVADQFVKNNWATGPNLFSHNGISMAYKETTHTDPYGYFARFGKTWNDFCLAVDSMIEQLKTPAKPAPAPTPAPIPTPAPVQIKTVEVIKEVPIVHEVVKEVPVEKIVQFDTLVVYSGDGDRPGAEYLAVYFNAPIMPLENIPKKILDAAEKVYVVGGVVKPTPNATLISGNDRFDTALKVLQGIKAGGQW